MPHPTPIRILLAALALCASAAILLAADIAPQQLSGIVLTRGATRVIETTNTVFVQGDALLITNLVLCSDSAGAVRQDLTDLSVQIGVGDATTTTWTLATAILATNGTCFATVTVPALNPTFWQVRINTNAFHYERQTIPTVAPLQ